jgi:hypothetical protein
VDSLEDFEHPKISSIDEEYDSERGYPIQSITKSLLNIHEKASTKDENARFAKEKAPNIWEAVLPGSSNKAHSYKYHYFS